MTMMIRRNLEGRDTGSGLQEAVTDKSVIDLLSDRLERIERLLLALVNGMSSLVDADLLAELDDNSDI